MERHYTAIRDLYYHNILVAKRGDDVIIDDNHFLINKSRGVRIFNYPSIVEDWMKQDSKMKETNTNEVDKVNHPSHYTWLKDLCGIEVIDITRHMDFCLGNAIKYIFRAGYKSEEGYSNRQKEIEDLKKAVFYINDRINQLQCGIAKKE